jgi:uncharacterized membrane protein
LARRWFGIAALILGLLYPFLVFYALPRFSALWLFAALACLIGVRTALLWHDGKLRQQVWLLLGGLLLLSFLAIFDLVLAVKAYPVMVSFALAAVFAYGLIKPPCMVERMARLTGNDLNQTGIRYARRVSFVWVLFGLTNAMISLATALFGSLEIWTLYNGFISYLAIGTLFAIEFIVRQFVKAGHIDKIEN